MLFIITSKVLSILDIATCWWGDLFVCLAFSGVSTQKDTGGWATYLWGPNGLKSGEDRGPGGLQLDTDAAASTSSTSSTTLSSYFTVTLYTYFRPLCHKNTSSLYALYANIAVHAARLLLQPFRLYQRAGLNRYFKTEFRSQVIVGYILSTKFLSMLIVVMRWRLF